MELNAVSRLLAVKVVPQSEAYSDQSGEKSLAKFRTFVRHSDKVKTVPTNDKDTSLVVHESPNKRVYIVGMLRKGRMVGMITINPTSSYGHKGWEPSSFVLPKYRGQGLALMVYKWLLDNGFKLMTGLHQSQFSNGLWKRLSREYKLIALGNGEVLKGKSALSKAEDPAYVLVLSR